MRSPYKLEDKLDFGKYKGLTIKEVMSINSNWIWWACRNIGWLALDTEAQEALPSYKTKNRRISFFDKQPPDEWASEEEWQEYIDMESCFENY